MKQPDYEGYQTVYDVRIHYLIFGKENTKTLLFLHGNGEDWRCFQNQIEDFSRDYQVFLLDSRGHGQSTHGKEPLTLRQIAKDNLAFLKALQLKDVSLVGFSDGANIALLMALMSSYPFETMILAGGNLFPRGMKFSVEFPIILQYYRLSFLPFLKEDQKKEKEYLGLMVREPNIFPESLEKITCPVLVLAGGRDMIKLRHTRLISKSLPNSTLAIVPEADHFLFGKWWQETDQLIRNFLAQNHPAQR